MKKKYEIYRDYPKVELKLTRDSVCAGDDCDAPHERLIEIHSFVSPEVLIANLLSYLPTGNGIGHSWICKLNGLIIGEVDKDGVHSKIREIHYETTNEIHFVYRSARY